MVEADTRKLVKEMDAVASAMSEEGVGVMAGDALLQVLEAVGSDSAPLVERALDFLSILLQDPACAARLFACGVVAIVDERRDHVDGLLRDHDCGTELTETTLAALAELSDELADAEADLCDRQRKLERRQRGAKAKRARRSAEREAAAEKAERERFHKLALEKALATRDAEGALGGIPKVAELMNAVSQQPGGPELVVGALTELVQPGQLAAFGLAHQPETPAKGNEAISALLLDALRDDERGAGHRLPHKLFDSMRTLIASGQDVYINMQPMDPQTDQEFLCPANFGDKKGLAKLLQEELGLELTDEQLNSLVCYNLLLPGEQHLAGLHFSHDAAVKELGSSTSLTLKLNPRLFLSSTETHQNMVCLQHWDEGTNKYLDVPMQLGGSGNAPAYTAGESVAPATWPKRKSRAKEKAPAQGDA